MRDRQAALEAKRQALLEAGVDMMDPSSVYVEDSVQVGEGTCSSPAPFYAGTPWWAGTARLGPT